MVMVAGAMIGLHLFTLDVIYPRVIVRRLELNPLVVTVGLLFWGWLWGAMGLLLAIPILAAIKGICDQVGGLQALGEWMGSLNADSRTRTRSA